MTQENILTDILAEIPYAEVELRWPHPLAGVWQDRCHQLRGALAHAFPEDDRFHQHDETGRELYRNPRIHYRWRNGYGTVAGWLDCAEALLNLPWLNIPVRLGGDETHISDALIDTRYARFGLAQELLRYRFAAPVLLFSQKNYRRYQSMSEHAQTRERDLLLRNQMLAAFKGLGIQFPVLLYTAFTECRPVSCRLKGQTLLGMAGEFVSNALLPAGFAFGKSTSHGYGWVEPLETSARQVTREAM